MSAPQEDEAKFGPALRGGSGRAYGFSWLRVGRVFLGVVLVLSIVAVGTVGALIFVANTSRKTIPIAGLQGLLRPESEATGTAEPEVDEVTEILNILVVGSDSREGLTDDQLQALGTDGVDGMRTDTIILLHIDPSQDRIAMLGFPRDLLVTRCDGSRGRINGAFGIGEADAEGGGADCLVQTVTGFTGIPIDHYVQVNFSGFIDVVDSIGGVSFFLDEPLRDREAGLDLPAGCVTLDGAKALGFVRARKLDSDFGRIARQQRFMREIVQKATSVGTLANVPRLFDLVRSAASAVTTDQGLGLRDMQRLAFSLRDLTNGGIDTRTVPGVSQIVGGADLVVVNEDEAEQLFTAFRDGSIFPENIGLTPPSATPPPELTPGEVDPVAVLNGSGIAGLAAKAAMALEDAGFEVSETGNAERFGYVQTQIVFAPQDEEAAQLLAETLGGAALVPGTARAELAVILGADFDPDALPSPRASGSASAGASASASGSPRPSASSSRSPSRSPSPGTSTQQFVGAGSSTVSC